MEILFPLKTVLAVGLLLFWSEMYCVSKAVQVELSKDALPMLSHPMYF